MSDFYKALSSAIYVSRQTLAGQAIETDDQKIRASGLYEDWTEGKHTRGEIYNAEGQTWECYQDYDNAVYPDIKPGEAAWYTFNRPLHGKSRETARPWVQPTHSMDMYKMGEWMIWTDGAYYECVAEAGTSFGPGEYPAGWRKENAV
jgi:hypothetical protein